MSNDAYKVDPEATEMMGVYDFKTSFRSDDHNGWFLLDGREISTLTDQQQTYCEAMGWDDTLPDQADLVLMGAGTNTVGETSGGSWTIARANLPKVNLGASSMTIKPYGSVSSSQSSHTHTVGYGYALGASTRYGIYLAGGGLTTDYGEDIEGDGTKGYYPKHNSTNTWGSSNGYHNHSCTSTTPSITSTFTGTSKSYTTPNAYLNGNVTQTSFNPPALAVNMFVYLGLD